MGNSYVTTIPPANGMLVQGNVGIGTTTPVYKLDVAGDINSTTALRFSGTQVCTSAGCTAVSDRTLKENIQPLQSSLDKILSLDGVEYDWKDQQKYGQRHQIGLIAQDLEKIYPEVVVTDFKTGLKSVAYDHLIAPLIESIKELNKRLAGIFSESQGHSKELADLKVKNLNLETTVQVLNLRVKEIDDLKAKNELLTETSKVLTEKIKEIDHLEDRMKEFEKALKAKKNQ